jgi:hypothetical protein
VVVADMAVEVIYTYDAEAAIRTWLMLACGENPPPGGPVVVIVPPSPSQWPARSVYVQRTGGSMRSLVVEQVQLTIECRAPTPKQALDLALHIRALVGVLRRSPLMGGIPVYGGGEVSAPYYDPDPDNDTLARVSQTHTLNLRAYIEKE